MKPIVKKSFNGLPALFNDDLFFSNFLTKETFPAVNVKEEDKYFELEVVAPGIKKDDFKLEIDNQTMTISGEAEKSSEKQTNQYYHQEYAFESFSRQFILPENTIADKITARYNDGVLKINLPKTSEGKANTKKQIAIG